MKERLICFVLGLVFGTFPTGYLYASLKGVNIRKMGSGNVGSTNMLRSMGPKAGAVTLVGDMLKTFIPLWITSAVFRNQTDIRYVLAIWTGVGAMLGHCYSPFLGFNGGKGVACFFAFMFLSFPLGGAVTAVFAVVVFLLCHMMSLVSMTSSVLFTILCLVNHAQRPWLWIFAFLCTLIIIVRHRSNIRRIIAGTEGTINY